MEKFLGGSPVSVMIRLVVLSILVGIVLAALGLQPFDIFTGIRRLVDYISSMGMEAFEKAFGYLLTGAIIVIPIWLIARLLSAGKARKKS